MIPLGDVVPRRTWPVVTPVVAVTLLSSVLVSQIALTAEQRWGLLWRLGASFDTFPWPALVTAWCVEPSWVAGLANAGALLLFGPSVEDRLGPLRMSMLLAVAAAVSVTLGAALVRPPALPVAGAAAPVAAVLATYLSLYPSSKLVFWVPGVSGGSLHEVPAPWGMACWLIIVAGRLVDVGPGLESVRPLAGVAVAGLLAFLTATRLPPRDRLSVTWWSEGPQH